MGYVILDCNVAEPLPALDQSESDDGVAILWRRQGRPLAFWMSPPQWEGPLEQSPSFKDSAARLAEKALQEAIREEIVPLKPDNVPIRLSVAVCTRDRPPQLERLLQSLERLPTRLANFWEVIVVDNAPSDGRTREIAHTHHAQYFLEPRPGLDFARNRALHEARGDYLAYLDDDVVVDFGWLKGLLDAISRFPEVGAVTGQVLPYELRTPAQIIFERRGGFRRGFETVCYTEKKLGCPYYPCGSGIFGVGANMAFRCECLRDLGGFDEALDTGPPLPGGGDLDIFYRVVRGGYALVYEPSCLVFHQHRLELGILRRQYWSWGLAVMALITKSFFHDPSQRGKLARLSIWWFKDQSLRLSKAILHWRPMEAGLVYAELLGSVMGLLGGYSRSRKRSERIRRQFL
jgi:glycosyltransferase involved in cell wall biosynthesis